jgi:light-harvesting complex 1 beta chain
MNESTFGHHKSFSREDRRSLFVLYAPCYLILLAFALLGRLVGLRWQFWLPGAEHKNSVFSGVDAAVYSLLSHIV